MSGINLIHIPCPACMADNAVQVQSGSCMGEDLSLEAASLSELDEIIGSEFSCEKCNRTFIPVMQYAIGIALLSEDAVKREKDKPSLTVVHQ